MHTFKHIYIYTHTHAHTSIYIYTHTHIYIYIYVYIYIYIYKQRVRAKRNETYAKPQKKNTGMTEMMKKSLNLNIYESNIYSLISFLSS